MDTLKKLSYSISKKDFAKLLYPLPESKIFNRINEIIYARRKDYLENKGKTARAIKGALYIERAEYIEYFETYGYPQGIEINEDAGSKK